MKTIINNNIFQHLLFWLGVLIFSIFASNAAAKMGAVQSIEIYGTIVFCQFIAALVCLNFLIPQLLNKKRYPLFILSLLFLILSLFAVYIIIRMNYLEVKYFDYYNKVMPEYITLSFSERIVDLRILLSKGIRYLSPTALILLIRYYKNQQKYLELNEQKKTAELSALKNQLNPHFLFNTLNNLYALALKKSDKTPEVISKLSDILDYMLYRCNDKFVSLSKEVKLIENYISLEKIRYGKRVKTSLNVAVNEEIEIAPLLLLTIIENAFKHGVSQEINQAQLDIDIRNDNKDLYIEIKNTIPKSTLQIQSNKKSIGLMNLKKQLELLYPERHQLKLEQSDTHYSVQLKLDTQ